MNRRVVCGPLAGNTVWTDAQLARVLLGIDIVLGK